MSNFIGRKVSVGIGKESVRGTAVAASYWLPKIDFKHDDKIDVVVDETTINTIADAQGQDTVYKYSEGEITGRLTDTSIGLWLIALMGTDTPAQVASSTAYDHVFTIAETATHPLLTVAIAEANASTGIRYTASAIDSMEFNFEIGKYATYKTTFRGNANAAGANTAAFTAENVFLPQHGSFGYAATYTGLSSPTTVNIKKAVFKVSKNIEDDQVIGLIAANDRFNKQFVVEGSIELLYSDRTFIDTIMLGSLSKAMRLTFANSDVAIATTYHPTLTFDFAKVQLKEVARDLSNNNLVRQTLSFKAYYSMTDTLMFKATLRNLISTTY